MMTQTTFKLGDSAVFFGGTGSGKTTLASEFVRHFYMQSQGKINIYILDSKASGDFVQFTQPGFGVHYFGDEVPPMKNADGSPFIVWTPDTDDKEMYDQFFHDIFMNGRRYKLPAMVFIDELSSISPTGRTAPRYYDTILKQGRGMGISVLSLTQMARFIPAASSSQLTHCFFFNMNSESDKKKMGDVFGNYAKARIPDPHGFWYRDLKKPVTQNPPRYYKSYKDFF
jgi:DNA helicase HerA-like ATPase